MPNQTSSRVPPAVVPQKLSPLNRVMAQFRTVQETLKQVSPATMSSTQDLAMQTQIALRDVEEFLADLKLQSTGGWTGSVSDVKSILNKTIGMSSDIVLRDVSIGRSARWPALACFVSGLVDTQMVDQDIIRRLESFVPTSGVSTAKSPSSSELSNAIMCASSVKSSTEWEDALIEMLAGSTLLFVEGNADILLLDTAKYPQRAITQSTSEPALKGPQEAFSDVGIIQMSQLRRRLATPDLRFDSVTIGRYSHTKIQLAYIHGLTNPKAVDMMRMKLSRISRDWVQIGQEVTATIAEKRYTLFPVVRLTDRVDIVARDLMQGKVAILVPNDPFVVTYPNRFIDFYQTTQDYVFNFWEATVVRIIRLLGIMAGLYTMPFYIALTSVDPDLIPTRLALTLTGSRIGVPFPPVTEAAIMWMLVEIIREAANRLPQQISTTIGTVGAVIIGTGIVKAGLVDPIVIIGTTLSALGLYTIPSWEMNAPWRWIFWLLVGASYFLGVYGIVLATFVLVGYLASLEVMGVPYLAPFAPLSPIGLKDSWVRFPLNSLNKRPAAYDSLQKWQQGDH